MSTVTFKDCFLQLTTILTYLGVWPTNAANPIFYWMYALFVFIFFEILLATLPLANLFVKKDVGILEIASCIFLNLQILIVPFKSVIFLKYHKNLRKATEAVCCSNEDDQKHINEEGALSMKSTFQYFYLCFATLLLMALSPLINLKEKPLLIEMWLPFDHTVNWFNYFSIYLYSTVALGFCAMFNSTVMIFTCGLLIYSTTQIKILKETLTNIQYSSEPKEVYNGITKCAKRYAEIISSIKFLESTLSLMLALQFFNFTIVLCMSSFLLTVTPSHGVFFIGIVFYLCCILVETFLFCHCGQQLSTEGSTITDSIYFGDWYNCDRKSKKALIILMERAKVPLTITVAGLFPLSNGTFTALVQKAYSFFTVLQSMDIEAT